MLDGRVALITGAASGQGRAAAVLFASHGASIAVIDVNDDGARRDRRPRREGRRRGDRAARRCVRRRRLRPDGVRHGRRVRADRRALQQRRRPDVGPLVECTEDDWDRTIATNLNAVFWACRAAIPVMLGGEGGSIINTAPRCSGSSARRATSPTAPPRPGSSRSPARSRWSTGRRCGPT